MGDVGFGGMLQWWWGGLLALLLLGSLWKFEPRRARTLAVLTLLLGCLAAHTELLQLVSRCEIAVFGTSAGAFFKRTFDLPSLS